MIVGNLPDVDFLVGFVLGEPGAFHRGVSHTIVAAVAFAVAAGLVASRRGRDRFVPAALVFGAAYCSHLLVDFLTIDTRPPAGVELLWPFSSAYFISPVTLFTEIHIDGATRMGFLETVLAWPTLVVLARETVLAIVAVVTWGAVAAWRAPAESQRPALSLAQDPAEEDLV